MSGPLTALLLAGVLAVALTLRAYLHAIDTRKAVRENLRRALGDD